MNGAIDIDYLATALASSALSSTTLADGSGVLVNLHGMEVLTFNETGMLIVNRLRRGDATLEELASAIAEEFQTDVETARRDAKQFVEKLASALKPREEPAER